MSLAPYALPPSQPLLRLHLAPATGGPRAIDGVWWPRSYDLLRELPVLLAGLPPTWGHITSVRLNGALWATAPGRLLVAGQVVRLRRSPAANGTAGIVLLSPGRGRWDLLVVPPDTAGADQSATSPEFLANFLEQDGR
ncbi:DUF5994 family protein [Streptomyces sp. N35]|uniref:DUF5994 family protein n=1 Tax=Streptomyces sp. N35 TaxID=2795730 RepID=UPI0018F7152B|nr:DUF5994 family protein [Streptomyces sp. N35]